MIGVMCCEVFERSRGPAASGGKQKWDAGVLTPSVPIAYRPHGDSNPGLQDENLIS